MDFLLPYKEFLKSYSLNTVGITQQKHRLRVMSKETFSKYLLPKLAMAHSFTAENLTKESSNMFVECLTM